MATSVNVGDNPVAKKSNKARGTALGAKMKAASRLAKREGIPFAKAREQVFSKHKSAKPASKGAKGKKGHHAKPATAKPKAKSGHSRSHSHSTTHRTGGKSLTVTVKSPRTNPVTTTKKNQHTTIKRVSVNPIATPQSALKFVAFALIGFLVMRIINNLLRQFMSGFSSGGMLDRLLSMVGGPIVLIFTYKFAFRGNNPMKSALWVGAAIATGVELGAGLTRSLIPAGTKGQSVDAIKSVFPEYDSAAGIELNAMGGIELNAAGDLSPEQEAQSKAIAARMIGAAIESARASGIEPDLDLINAQMQGAGLDPNIAGIELNAMGGLEFNAAGIELNAAGIQTDVADISHAVGEEWMVDDESGMCMNSSGDVYDSEGNYMGHGYDLLGTGEVGNGDDSEGAEPEDDAAGMDDALDFADPFSMAPF